MRRIITALLVAAALTLALTATTAVASPTAQQAVIVQPQQLPSFCPPATSIFGVPHGAIFLGLASIFGYYWEDGDFDEWRVQPFSPNPVGYWHKVTVTRGPCAAGGVAAPAQNNGFLAYSKNYNDNTEAVNCKDGWTAERARGATVPIAAEGYTPVGNNTNTIKASWGSKLSYGLAGNLPAGYKLVQNIYVGADGTVFVGQLATEPCWSPLAIKA